MKNLFKIAALATSILVAAGCTSTLQAESNVEAKQSGLLASLPQEYNSPASFTIDAYNNVLFTSPNLHNDTFVKQGIISQPATPVIGVIDQNNDVATWYTFKPEDMEPTSGTIVPMGLAKGPDGNIYIADMQLWAGGESRIIRVNVKEGKAIDVDVVAKGMSFPNALAWHDDNLYVTDTVLSSVKDTSTTSGVYKLNIKELNAKNPVKIDAFKSKDVHDKHLFETFTSNGSLGFGANGLTFDDQGNMYTGLMEDGTVVKTTLDAKDNKVSTKLFADGMVANDGMHWDKSSQSLYITDLFDNAMYSIDLNGKLTLLAKNGDTDGANGELDAPGEVIVRGKQAYVNNFDAAFGAPTMVNKKADAPVTISVIELK